MKDFILIYEMARERARSILSPFLLRTLLFPDQTLDYHVPVAIRFLVVVSENVSLIAVIENMVIYKKEGVWLWIGYSLDVCNVLKDGDLQTLGGRTEFDVPHANRILRPSYDRRLASGFEV